MIETQFVVAPFSSNKTLKQITFRVIFLFWAFEANVNWVENLRCCLLRSKSGKKMSNLKLCHAGNLWPFPSHLPRGKNSGGISLNKEAKSKLDIENSADSAFFIYEYV